MTGVLLTVDEVAARLKCHPHTVRRWIWAHKMNAVKVGDLVRVPDEELTRFMVPQGPRPRDSERRGAAALAAFVRRLRKSPDVTLAGELERVMAEGEQEADWSPPLG